MDMINNEVCDSSSELLQAQAQVWNSTFNYINSMSLNCAVQLAIPDIIHNHGEPMPLSKMVEALNVHPDKAQCIQRLMRILVHSGFFAQQISGDNEQEEEYFLTPASRLLLKDQPLSAAPFVLLMTDPIITTPFHFLSKWFPNNENPTVFETAHGKEYWDFVAQEKAFKKVFYDAMVADSELMSSIVIKDCKQVFKGLNSLVDLGGGTGAMSIAIATAFPDIKCTVFDLPHIVDNLHGTTNLEFRGGDMFEAIPPANAVLLKWILHDWGDEESVNILKKCKEAIPSKDKGGKVIIIDMAIQSHSQDKNSTETQLCFDMVMMSLFNTGKERSVKEWGKLFVEAGFSDYKITPILGLRSLIEVYP